MSGCASKDVFFYSFFISHYFFCLCWFFFPFLASFYRENQCDDVVSVHVFFALSCVTSHLVTHWHHHCNVVMSLLGASRYFEDRGLFFSTIASPKINEEVWKRKYEIFVMIQYYECDLRSTQLLSASKRVPLVKLFQLVVRSFFLFFLNLYTQQTFNMHT